MRQSNRLESGGNSELELDVGQECLILSDKRSGFNYLLIVSIIQSVRLEIAVKSSLFGRTLRPVALF